MLVRRTLSVGGQGPQGQQIVRLEQFRDSQAAVDVLSRAREQAEALLVEAQAVRQQVLDDATAQFWERARDFVEPDSGAWNPPAPSDPNSSRSAAEETP